MARLTIARVLGLAAAALLLAACGREVPHGGARVPPNGERPPAFVKRLDPSDVIPADLDVVVRIDVARLRSDLGSVATDDLEAHAVSDDDEALLLGAIQKADVVWIALRVGDFDAGDRVIVVEGPWEGFSPDARVWRRVPNRNGAVGIFERSPGARNRTQRIIALGPRALAFVTPVEIDAVARVMASGADAKRGEPSAEGLLSLDVRAHRLPLPLERRFPSFAALVAGLDRIRAEAVLVDEGIRIEASIVARDPTDADSAQEFLKTVRDNLDDARFAGLKKATIEVTGSTVRVRAVVPAKLVLGLLEATP